MQCEKENDMIKKPLNNLPRLLTAMILAALPLGMTILLSSCGDVFDTHPYDVNVKGETDINAKQIAVIEKQFANKEPRCLEESALSFRGSDRQPRFPRHW